MPLFSNNKSNTATVRLKRSGARKLYYTPLTYYDSKVDKISSWAVVNGKRNTVFRMVKRHFDIVY